MKRRRLYVTDMDGTLLGGDSRVSPESARIISELSRDGALITVATARTPATVDPLLRNTVTTPPAIVMTGASMWLRAERRYLDPAFIPEQWLPAIVALFLERDIHPFVYTLEPSTSMLTVYHHGALNRAERRFVDERRHLTLKKFVLDASETDLASPDRPVMLIFATGPVEAIYSLAAKLNEATDCSVSHYADIFNPSQGYIEVFAAGVSKAGAVERLADLFGAESVVVFGDNLNDLPMMAVADEAIAVANALPEVKERATKVIGPNTASSVARYIYDDFYS